MRHGAGASTGGLGDGTAVIDVVAVTMPEPLVVEDEGSVGDG